MKKTLSIVLAVILTLSLASVVAFAADKKPTMSSIKGKTSINKGKTATFEVTVKAGDGIYSDVSESDVHWESSDDDVVWIDGYGEAEAMDYGECTITAYIYARKEDKVKGYTVTSSKVVTKSITVRVPGGPKSAYPENSDIEESSKSSSSIASSSKSTSGSTSGEGQIPTSTVTSAIRGSGSSFTFKGYTSVSSDTITSAKTTATNLGKKVTLNFDTYTDNKFDARMTINPANASNMASKVNTGVSINDDSVGKYRTLFNKYFKNENMAFIKMNQSGSLGMTAEVVAKVDLGGFGNTKYVYTYDPATGKYAQVKGAALSKDSNNFWHITTTSGGVLVITDSPLKK